MAAEEVDARDLLRGIDPSERRCRFCRAKGTGRRIDECEPCSRQKNRLKGLTECCELLPLRSKGRLYCPGCPGTGKVGPIILISPDGHEELQSWHPPDATASGLKRRMSLEQIAVRTGVKVSDVVLMVLDERAWALRRLDYVRDRDLGPVMRSFKCPKCGQVTQKYAYPQIPSSRLVCEPCKRRRQTECEREARAKRPGAFGQCTGCRTTRAIKARGMCAACWHRESVNGRCECGEIKVRPMRREPCCPKCTPIRHQRLHPTVTVTVVDGKGGEWKATVSWKCPVGAGTTTAPACTWIEPILLGDCAPATRPNLRLPVISGIKAPMTSAETRALLPMLHDCPRSEALGRLTQILGSAEEAKGRLSRLILAGLYDDGLTERARAILRWCEAAGVRL